MSLTVLISTAVLAGMCRVRARAVEARAFVEVCDRLRTFEVDATALAPPTVHYARRLLVADAPGYTILGYFDDVTHEITVTRPLGIRRVVERVWKIPFSAELQYSILVHEMTHYVIGASVGDVPMEVHEFIAFAVQIASLSQDTRDRLFSVHTIPDFRSCADFTADCYSILGLRFGLGAYEFSQTYPERARLFLRGETEALVRLDPLFGEALRERNVASMLEW